MMSVEPILEEQGQPRALLSGAMVRVRAESAEAFSSGLQLLATEQLEIAASHYKRGDFGNANAYGVIADVYKHIDQNFRRLMELPSERQPDSNTDSGNPSR